MRRTGFERAKRIRNRAARIVVPVKFDARLDQSTQTADELMHALRRRHAHRVGNAKAIDADLVDGEINAIEIGFFAAKRVLGTEAQFEVRRLRTQPTARSITCPIAIP